MYRKHIWKSFAVAGNYFLEYLYCIKFGAVMLLKHQQRLAFFKVIFALFLFKHY